MNLTLTFMILFVGGPLVFRLLIWMAIKPKMLGAIAATIMFVAIALRYGFRDQWGVDIGLTISALFLIWMAWIAVLVLGVQAMRAANPGQKTHQWSAVIGSAGTTVPWFGLAYASWVEG